MSDMKIIPFMKQRYLAAVFSVVLVIGSIASLAVNGLSLGLDFTGGALVELKYENTADLNAVREDIEELGFPGAAVIYFGSDRDVQVRFQTDNPKKGDEVGQALIAKSDQNVEVQRISYVGPQIGEELTKLNFDLTVLAAVLAVVGYSLNDTIVVADRIRENFRVIRKSDSRELVDISLTQTLERTLITSLTTLLVLIALYYFGGEMIHNFALALIIGVVVGTYSSIYVSANVLLAMKITREDLLPVEKEGEEFEEVL